MQDVWATTHYFVYVAIPWKGHLWIFIADSTLIYLYPAVTFQTSGDTTLFSNTFPRKKRNIFYFYFIVRLSLRVRLVQIGHLVQITVLCRWWQIEPVLKAIIESVINLIINILQTVKQWLMSHNHIWPKHPLIMSHFTSCAEHFPNAHRLT